MVKEYLEKTRNEFLQQKQELEEKENSISKQIKETIQFIHLLEQTKDPNLEAFTPRDVNERHREKVIELKEQQNELTKELGIVRESISNLDFKIYEINSVIKVAEQDIESIPHDKNYGMTILSVQENERQRIARDLHDTTVQNLISLIHKSELCCKLCDLDINRCKSELTSMNKLLRDVIEDTRKMIYDLRPIALDDVDFHVTVERFLDKLKQLHHFKCSYKITGNPFTIDNVIEITLLRIIQEACNNSMKHGKANNFSVELIYHNDIKSIEIIMTDDGVGFDTSQVESTDVSREDNSGFGLSMMKERIDLLSGTHHISSRPGRGCTVSVKIPI